MSDSTAYPSGGHFVDIHEVEEEEEDEDADADGITEMGDKAGQSDKRASGPNTRAVRLREMKRTYKGFGRQMSLETGFSAMNKEKKADKRSLVRSGRSLGVGERAASGEMKKGDFSRFMTKSSLSKQNSLIPMKKERAEGEAHSPEDREGAPDESINRSVPVGRYFAALRGPELDEVKDSEDILLPKDEKWPFLLRFPIGCFGICLGLSSQAILWRALATSPATKFLHIPPYINLVIWLLAVSVLLLVSLTYTLKFIFYFEAVRREYFHPVRVNFFFAPWVVCMFLALSAPPVLFPEPLHPAIWCAFMIPYFILELKIYGQWLSGGKRRLCKVANPSSHLSVVGNFVGAILAARVGWLEPAKFLWAVGFAHYMVLFVTLYQRLPTSEALPKELHPVYSMFIAAPSAASLAWEAIYGEFDGMSRNCYFTALFLYISLVVRISFFWGFKFSVAWWSYTFPMTTVSIATIKYAEHVPSGLSKGLALSLAAMSSTMVSVLLVSTLLHGFVWRTLFPNDLAIAITEKRHVKDKKPIKKGYDIRRWAKETHLPFVSSSDKVRDVDDEKEARPQEFGSGTSVNSILRR